jgi:hypothetical protein
MREIGEAEAMKTIDITTKLTSLGCPVDDMMLGDFDAIGEHTAKKARMRGTELYKTIGCYFRPNYERGLLAHAYMKRYRPKRILEIGFGRGYWTTCMAKAAYDCNVQCEIYSVDTTFDRAHIDAMSKIFPPEWLQSIRMVQGRSIDVVSKLEGGKFDLINIDGDRTHAGIKSDWNTVKDIFTQHVIFNEYHLPGSKHAGPDDFAVADVVNSIDVKYERELIVMDRLVFPDDRREPSDEKRYGQVLVRHPDFVEPIDPYVYAW